MSRSVSNNDLTLVTRALPLAGKVTGLISMRSTFFRVRRGSSGLLRAVHSFGM